MSARRACDDRTTASADLRLRDDGVNGVVGAVREGRAGPPPSDRVAPSPLAHRGVVASGGQTRTVSARGGLSYASPDRSRLGGCAGGRPGSQEIIVLLTQVLIFFGRHST